MLSFMTFSYSWTIRDWLSGSKARSPVWGCWKNSFDSSNVEKL